MKKFTLEEGKWYALELIGDEFIDLERGQYSPIRVLNIHRMHTSKRIFKLGFYHANYPQGVQDKNYVLETIERGEDFILAKSMKHNPSRILNIQDIDWKWIHQHFSYTCKQAIERNWSIENFLYRNC